MYNKMANFDAPTEGDLCQTVCESDPYYDSPGHHYYTQLYPADSQNSGSHVLALPEEEGYWGSPCSSSGESPENRGGEYSPVLSSHSGQEEGSPYGQYHHHPQHHHQNGSNHLHNNGDHGQHQQVYCPVGYDKASYICDEGYYGIPTGTSISSTSNGSGVGLSTADSLLSINSGSGSIITGSSLVSSGGGGVPVVRVVKRRNTANKKERRRTQSINSAYTSLRDRIPNVPNDTKLSKIKTLRLAISYIAHLLAVVNGNQDPSCDFRAELVPSSRKINAERRAQKSMMQNLANEGKKIKGRTGWPQHVWALETKTTIK
ncbi:heart- and neural crest derivatives-expressed protein 1 [Uranotaenia lowii]|uniref:heart- and neural crest derivatives-expressed protein 1 n=1 Tax=Uranotaenia lowii TaxID=190385 RepID=UPI00247A3673|nr:heart- and neural crest derivatives-expressed protein 1 [Uranotaenia lowii]